METGTASLWVVEWRYAPATGRVVKVFDDYDDAMEFLNDIEARGAIDTALWDLDGE